MEKAHLYCIESPIYAVLRGVTNFQAAIYVLKFIFHEKIERKIQQLADHPNIHFWEIICSENNGHIALHSENGNLQKMMTVQITYDPVTVGLLNLVQGLRTLCPQKKLKSISNPQFRPKLRFYSNSYFEDTGKIVTEFLTIYGTIQTKKVSSYP